MSLVPRTPVDRILMTLRLVVICVMLLPLSDAYGQDQGYVPQPLKSGDLTLEDVLEQHPHKPDTSLSQLAAPQQNQAPTPSASVGQVPSSNLLIQGMRSALQGSDLPPPQINASAQTDVSPTQSSNGALPELPPLIVEGKPTPSPLYVPGQEPRDLSKSFGASLPSTPTKGTDSQATLKAPVLDQSSAPIAKSQPLLQDVTTTEGCQQKHEAWVRKCTDAGYPATFVGQIKGETRTSCPDGALHDVWIENTCAPPDDADTTPENGQTANPETQSPQHHDGLCGSSNGLASAVKPKANLCSGGIASEVSGTGPWLWNCSGEKGGSTVSCAAPLIEKEKIENKTSNVSQNTVDGICGPSNGMNVTTAPHDSLCDKGKASQVRGNGPWSWACSGVNGGKAASCEAAKRTNGECGKSSGQASTTMPSDGLCLAGYASAVSGEGPWHWTCGGLNGGDPALCEADLKRDAVCGTSATEAQSEAPKDNLCSQGNASVVTGSGPWLWTCHGLKGGADVACTSLQKIIGKCGSANGAAVTEAPSVALCQSGTASKVEGLGPFVWSCVGSDQSERESCEAPLAKSDTLASLPPLVHDESTTASSSKESANQPTQKSEVTASLAPMDQCGSAAELAAFEVPKTDLCRGNSEASLVNGEGPWTWTCTGSDGVVSHCSTLAPSELKSINEADLKSNKKPSSEGESADVKGADAVPQIKEQPQVATCGSAHDKGTTYAPTDELCAVGRATKVSGKGPWKWRCLKGKTKALCEAPKLEDAVCGAQNGSKAKDAPSLNLCAKGTATSVEGSGPWIWTCTGIKGGANVSCSVGILEDKPSVIKGICGVATVSVSTQAPTDGLCQSGLASSVFGHGPYTWTCSGTNGGEASLCSTKKIVSLEPQAPGPQVNGLCGSSNGAMTSEKPGQGLCSSGTATQVVGDGPWNWNCLGENGGMTVSCTAALEPPSALSGECGSASGMSTLVEPSSGLCAAGIASAVNGRGPWTWSCSGINGGGAVGCVAPLAGSSKSIPSLVTPGQHPVSDLSAPQFQAPVPSKREAPSRSSFATPPEPTHAPEAASVESGSVVPSQAPALPEGTTGLQPPPASTNLKPTTSITETSQAPVPHGRLVLDDDLTVISFDAGSDLLDDNAVEILDKLTVILKDNGKSRITLTAYASMKNATPRDARRLSLARALVLRDYLSAHGVASSRIDVRALGVNVTRGDPDRVDITAN